MEIKKWNEYSESEKIELLHHWWYSYGKLIFTLAEWEQFNELLKKNSDQIFSSRWLYLWS